MKLLGILLAFGGYTLVYAAVARGGVFATEPWLGLYADAYETASGDAAATTGGLGSAVGAGAASAGSGPARAGSAAAAGAMIPKRPRFA